MKTSNHAAVRAVYAGSLAAVIIAGEAAHLAARTFGVMAGAAVIVTVFAACWLVFRVRPVLHPPRRPRASVPLVPSGNTSAEPAQPDLLPVL